MPSEVQRITLSIPPPMVWPTVGLGFSTLAQPPSARPVASKRSAVKRKRFCILFFNPTLLDLVLPVIVAGWKFAFEAVAEHALNLFIKVRCGQIPKIARILGCDFLH